VPNTELIELDFATVLDVKMDKMKKTLQAAHHLAAENHPLSYYKEVLQSYQEDLIEQEKAKAAKAATPKSKKSKAVSDDDDEDVEMEDVPEATETPAKSKKAKKRKAEDSVEVSWRRGQPVVFAKLLTVPRQTPARSDSVKKPKIKLTSSATPKVANGATSTPKSTKATEPKSAKSKPKKAKEAEEKVEKEDLTPKEPELSPEDRRARKEVLLTGSLCIVLVRIKQWLTYSPERGSVPSAQAPKGPPHEGPGAQGG
jgi:hypothetical protein